MKPEEQTDEVKLKLWELTNDFVNKWWISYYPQYKGGNPSRDDLYDLAADFYTEFLTPKGRGDVKESLLDKWDPGKVHDIGDFDKKFAALVKISVTRKLIDRARTDKGEIHYNEKYNEDTPDRLSLDFLSLVAPKGALGAKDTDPVKAIKETLKSDEFKGWKFTDQGLFDQDGNKVAKDAAEAVTYLDIDSSSKKMNKEEDLLYLLNGLNEESLEAAKSRWKDKPMRARKEVQEDYELYKENLDPKVANFIEKVIYDSLTPVDSIDFNDLDSVTESEYDRVIEDLASQIYDQGSSTATVEVSDKWSDHDISILKIDLKGWDVPFYDLTVEQIGDVISAKLS